MQPVIEVQCPFCDARGQIVTPPVGAIIVGPCPRCSELVLLFCGAVLPLDKEVILNASSDEKKAHLTETIMDLVVKRIEELVDNAEAHLDEEEFGVESLAELMDPGDAAPADAEAGAAKGEAAKSEAAEPANPPVDGESVPLRETVPSVAADHPTTGITEQEVRDFLDIDLHLIDRKVHFDRVFGPT